VRALCLTVANPFDPMGSRRLEVLRRKVRVRALAPRGPAPVIAILNGRPLLRAGWRRKLRDGDHLMFTVLPRGGGNGGSNPLQLILSLALMAFAPWMVSQLGPLFFTAGTASAAGALTLLGNAAVAGVVMAGQALISVLLPPPGGPGGLSLPGPSPTYSIQAQGNTARIEQAIPVQYGRMLFSPDFAAQPYTEFAGGDQYLYQLLCLGTGEFSVEQIRVEDTDISAFAEITTELVAPGAQVTLFPTAVVSSVEVAGQELVGMKGGTYSQSTTVVTVTEVGHGRAVGQTVYLDFTSGTAVDGTFLIATAPTVDTFTVTAASLTTSGNVNIRAVIGGINGFVAASSSAIAHQIGIDFVMPRGLFDTSGSILTDLSLTLAIEARQIDGNGVPIGSWITLGTEVFSDRTLTPIRKSVRYTLATPGRYAVRISRTDTKSISTTSGHEVLWAGMRSYLREPQNFGEVTLLAMRMRATNNLSLQASRRIKVLATRKIPVWNGSTWSTPVASTSIAWAIADAARNAAYGAGLADARIDLAALLALDAVWLARGDTFNGRFDNAGSFWDAVTRIAACGRAQVFLQGGILRAVRDGAATLPVALYSMRNMIKGSFTIDYLQPTENTADAVDLSYFDATTWMPQRARAALPGSTSAKPIKVERLGITSAAQAMREGMYLAACNRYRRRIAKFSTEMEGFIPSIGDLIAVQHDMPGWGAHAEATGWNAATRVLVLSEPMVFAAGTYFVGLRRLDGGLSGPWQVTAGSSEYEVVLAATPDITPQVGSEMERTHVVFGLASPAVHAKVMSVKPRGKYEVGLEAVIEDPSVHTAETGVVAPAIILSSLPRTLTKPVIGGLTARLDPNDANRVLVMWQPAPGAETYQIEMAEGSDPAAFTGTWTRVADTTGSQFVLSLLAPFQTLIRVRGLGLAAGDWNATALGSLLGRFWNVNGALPMWTLGTDPMWRSL